MTQTDRTQLFDNWAERYNLATAKNDFPFAGYELILDEVVNLATVQPGMRILDLGLGTGNLAARFLKQNCLVWGLDFSARMLAQARAQWPQMNLVQANLLAEWPLRHQPSFDRVVSSYVLHEFNLETKVKLLQRIVTHYLSADGRILIGDISFPTASDRVQASQIWAAAWDADEYYWAADETITASEQVGLQMAYKQVSSCGGIFIFTRKA